MNILLHGTKCRPWSELSHRLRRETKKKKKKVTKGEWAGNTGTQSVALQHPGPPRCSSALFQLRSSLIFWHGRLKWFSIDKSDNNGLGDWMENRCLPQQHYQRRTGFVRAAGSPSWSLRCTCSDATSHCSERTNRDTLGDTTVVTLA